MEHQQKTYKNNLLKLSIILLEEKY